MFNTSSSICTVGVGCAPQIHHILCIVCNVFRGADIAHVYGAFYCLQMHPKAKQIVPIETCDNKFLIYPMAAVGYAPGRVSFFFYHHHGSALIVSWMVLSLSHCVGIGETILSFFFIIFDNKFHGL